MGWLLTIWLMLPHAESQVEVRMWLSGEHYCNFAQEKFLENPILHRLPHAAPPRDTPKVAKIEKSECRELKPEEAHLIPEHMR